MKRVVIIDNYDSFTHNLVHLLAGLADAVEVVRNDARDLDGILSLQPVALILSPGPGRPEEARDFGVCRDVVLASREGRMALPLMGVCLGHQGIAHGFGATVRHAPTVMHGKASAILHRGRGLFEGLPSPLEVMRYHSLVVDPATLPSELEPMAQTEDGILMAFAHRSRPIFGLQFHPESIGTPMGRAIMERFLDTAESGVPGKRTRAEGGARDSVVAGTTEVEETS